MYNFNDIRSVHIELTNNCQARCPMCARNVHGGVTNPLINITQIRLDEYKKILPPEFLNQISYIYFCGNYGDPIIADDLLDIIDYTKFSNPSIGIGIHTNGSARSSQWWERLKYVLPVDHSVHFAIDGLADTHSRYRIGTDFNKIIENASSFIDAGGNAEWVFLSFKHNEHQIEEARELSKKLKFKKFVHKATGRFVDKTEFDVYNKNGEVEYKLEPPATHNITFVSPEVIKNYKKYIDMAEIDCVVQKNKEIYIDTFKNLWPCCFLGSVPYNYINDQESTVEYNIYQKEMVKQLQDYLGNTNLLDRSIEEIINSDAWQSAWKIFWGDKKLPTCAKTCGKFKQKIVTQYGDQFMGLTINE